MVTRAEDYKYVTIPQWAIIDGNVMPLRIDASSLRFEDIAFLTEAINERTECMRRSIGEGRVDSLMLNDTQSIVSETNVDHCGPKSIASKIDSFFSEKIVRGAFQGFFKSYPQNVNLGRSDISDYTTLGRMFFSGRWTDGKTSSTNNFTSKHPISKEDVQHLFDDLKKTTLPGILTYPDIPVFKENKNVVLKSDQRDPFVYWPNWGWGAYSYGWDHATSQYTLGTGQGAGKTIRIFKETKVPVGDFSEMKMWIVLKCTYTTTNSSGYTNVDYFMAALRRPDPVVSGGYFDFTLSDAQEISFFNNSIVPSLISTPPEWLGDVLQKDAWDRQYAELSHVGNVFMGKLGDHTKWWTD